MRSREEKQFGTEYQRGIQSGANGEEARHLPLLCLVSTDNRDQRNLEQLRKLRKQQRRRHNSVTGVVEWTWKRQGIDLGVGADNHRMGIQSKTNDYQDRARLTKVPKGRQRK